jgi:hypothetical protein
MMANNDDDRLPIERNIKKVHDDASLLDEGQVSGAIFDLLGLTFAALEEQNANLVAENRQLQLQNKVLCEKVSAANADLLQMKAASSSKDFAITPIKELKGFEETEETDGDAAGPLGMPKKLKLDDEVMMQDTECFYNNETYENPVDDPPSFPSFPNERDMADIRKQEAEKGWLKAGPSRNK